MPLPNVPSAADAVRSDAAVPGSALLSSALVSASSSPASLLFLLPFLCALHIASIPFRVSTSLKPAQHPRHNRGGLEFGLEKKLNSSPSSQQLAWKTEKRRSREFFSVCHFAFEIVVVPVSSVPPIWPSPQFYGIYFKICRRGAPLT